MKPSRAYSTQNVMTIFEGSMSASLVLLKNINY
jgi:hypothetical protein